MDNRWTLFVENLGRIKEAEVKVAPFTLFVGANNSGKSYLMTILYTLLNLRLTGTGYNLCMDTSEYKDCEAWLESCVKSVSEEAPGKFPITAETVKKFERLLNLILSKNLKRISRQAFNTEVPIGRIAVSFPETDAGELNIAPVHVADYSPAHIENEEEHSQPIYRFHAGKGEGYRSVLLFETARAASYMLEYLIKRQFKISASADAAFLPTSRTGFLLTYRSLTNASLRQTLDFPAEVAEEEARYSMNPLTRPCSDFLKNLVVILQNGSSSRLQGNKYRNVLQFMEKNMLCGHITVRYQGPMSDVTYRPEGFDREIPMHLASGVVTEIAPLSLMLQYYRPFGRPFGTLFMEEPEMSLHPELQREMARTLIRIVNTKTPVFVTTHSDTILSHLNNMIKLRNQPEERQARVMSQLGYAKEDLISAEDVSMYQFDVERDGKSVVQALVSDAYGFEIPSFNDALEKLLNDTRKTDPEEDD